ncbi:MAG: rhomboid family intramembrane serine protease, partial [Myxococcota bacterium]
GLVTQGVRARFRFKGWILVFVLVLVAPGLGLAFVPQSAGYIAAVIWGVLFLIPALSARMLTRLVMQRRYVGAKWVARLLAMLHPMDGWREQPAMLAILAKIGNDELDALRADLSALRERSASLASFAELNLMRADGRWQELRDWIEASQTRDVLHSDGQAAVLYIRALGETGETEAMLTAYEKLRRTPIGVSNRQAFRLTIGAICGRVDLTRSLFDGSMHSAPRELRDYWVATAQQAAGRTTEAESTFRVLVTSTDPALRRAAQRRLLMPLPVVDDAQLTEIGRQTLARMGKAARDESRYGLTASARRRRTPITLTLLAVNVGVFVLELPGGSTDQQNLIDLGALVVHFDELSGQWWRIFTAGFLHFGWLHLVVNVVGLWIIGRYMERVWGRWSLLIAYLAATFGGNAIAMVAFAALYDSPGVAVGASGGVMGILGASMALVTVEWFRTRAPILRSQMILFGALLVLQTVFDLVTPQVSTTIHLAGLAIGLLCGLIASWRRPPQPSTA